MSLRHNVAVSVIFGLWSYGTMVVAQFGFNDTFVTEPVNCTGADVEFIIRYDNYPSEITYQLIDATTGDVLFSGSGQDNEPQTIETVTEECVDPGCYVLDFYDTWGDGMVWGGVVGTYSLLLDGDEITLGPTTFNDHSTQFYFCTDYLASSAVPESSNKLSFNMNEVTFNMQVLDDSGYLLNLTDEVVVYRTEYGTLDFASTANLYFLDDVCLNVYIDIITSASSGFLDITVNDAVQVSYPSGFTDIIEFTTCGSFPTIAPTGPSANPTESPTNIPTNPPTIYPSMLPTLSPTCGEDEYSSAVFTILYDLYPSEIDFELRNVDTGKIILSGNGDDNARQTMETVGADCVESGCYILDFYDSYGDGMVWAGVVGWYRLFWDEDEITLGPTTFDDHVTQFYFCTDYLGHSSEAESSNKLSFNMNGVTFNMQVSDDNGYLLNGTFGNGTDLVVYYTEYGPLDFASNGILYFLDDECLEVRIFDVVTFESGGFLDISLNDGAFISYPSGFTDEIAFTTCGSFPTVAPTGPSFIPTASPTDGPTDDPTDQPSILPTIAPTCSGESSTALFTILYDLYPGEIDFELRNMDTGTIAFSGNGDDNSPQTVETVSAECLEPGCYILDFYDSYGDGMVWAGVVGWYRLFWNEDEITLGPTTFNSHTTELIFCTDALGSSDEPESSDKLSFEVNNVMFTVQIDEGDVYSNSINDTFSNGTLGGLVYSTEYGPLDFASNSSLYLNNDECYTVYVEINGDLTGSFSIGLNGVKISSYPNVFTDGIVFDTCGNIPTTDPTLEPTLEPTQEPIYILNCQDMFGDECLSCDNSGCIDCDSGYRRLSAGYANTFVCQEIDFTGCGDAGPICMSHNCGDAIENPYCSSFTEENGCVACQYGYFRKSRQHACVSCDTIEGCEGCSNGSGCNSCSQGFIKYWDPVCNIFKCSNTCPFPQ